MRSIILPPGGTRSLPRVCTPISRTRRPGSRQGAEFWGAWAYSWFHLTSMGVPVTATNAIGGGCHS